MRHNDGFRGREGTTMGWENCMIKTSGRCGASLLPDDDERVVRLRRSGIVLLSSLAGFQQGFKIGGTWRTYE